MLNNLGGGIPFIKIGQRILKVNDISCMIITSNAITIYTVDGNNYRFDSDKESYKFIQFYIEILEEAGAIMDLKKVYDRKDVIMGNLEKLKKHLSEFSTNLEVGNDANENVQKLKEYIKNKLENQ